MSPFPVLKIQKLIHMLTMALLICSNIFMTFARHGHLKLRDFPLRQVIISSLITLPEYSHQAPAKRRGYGQFTAVDLKAIQGVVSLTVFQSSALSISASR